MSQSNTTYAPQPVANGLIPREGPKALPISYDFSTATSFDTDLTAILQQGKISLVQSIFIDNSLNTEPVSVTVAGVGQKITIPSKYQGIFPVFVTGQPKFTVESAGAAVVTVAYSNTEQASNIWACEGVVISPAAAVPVADAILDGTVSGSRVNTRSQAAPATLTDYSGTITAGGVAQQLMAANANRQGFLVVNIDETNLEPVAISAVGAAALAAPGSITLAPAAGGGYPGGSYQGVGTGAISIIATTTGHKFTAYEW